MKNHYRIEKGVPLSYTYAKYPFGSMDIGDSFLVKTKDKKAARLLIVSVINSAKSFCKRRELNWKFRAKTIDDRNIRIWRF